MPDLIVFNLEILYSVSAHEAIAEKFQSPSEKCVKFHLPIISKLLSRPANRLLSFINGDVMTVQFYDGKNVLPCTRRNVKCFNLQFHVHHYYHQFFMSRTILCCPWTRARMDRKMFEKRFFSFFLLITCLWINN